MKRSFFLPVFIAGLAAAASFSGSLEIQIRGVYSGSAGGFELQPVYAGSLLFSESWGDFYLDSALFPGWNLATRELWAGISKLELGYDAGSLAAGIGAAPETLTLMRLLPPFSLTAPRTDFAPGLWGGWLELSAAPSGRLRLALRSVAGTATGVLRLDGGVLAADYRLSAVYGPAPAPAAFGVGLSATLADWLVYGEVWGLLRESDLWRGALGVSRYLAGGLLAVEAAYAASPSLAAAYSWQPAADWSADALARLTLPQGAPAVYDVSARLTYAGGPGDVTLGLGLSSGGAGVVWLPSLTARVYY